MAEEYLTDDEQLEAVKHLAVEYAPWLIGGVLLGAAVFFGIRYFQSYTTERALKASAEFSAMTLAMQTNDHAKSRQIANGLIKEYGNTPYADQAQMTVARLDIDEGHPGDAVVKLTQVMTDSKDTELRQIARLRLARVLTDMGKYDEALKTLADPMSAAFASPYHEVRGDTYVAKKDIPAAITEYQTALGAADPRGINSALLELKIQDLGGVVTPLAKVIPADTFNKAKP